MRAPFSPRPRPKLWLIGGWGEAALGSVRTLTFSYQGTLPKLTSVTENGVPRTVTYDAVANETTVGSDTFAYSARNSLATGNALTYTYNGRGVRTVVTDVTAARRYFFYNPELNLLAETELTIGPAPAIVYEYIWFAGRSVAQVDGGTVTHWTFADHLGTPLIETDVSAAIDWRAEYEPYGRVFALRTPDRHQALGLPGQEAEQFEAGPNGATERFYNIFRWYRYGWGRYTQADPLGLVGGLNPYAYVRGNPVKWDDPLGLFRPEDHVRITEDAMRAEGCKVTPNHPVPLVAAGVDNPVSFPGTWSKENAHWHAMCPPGVTPNVGLPRITQYIAESINKCTLRGLGRALHAAQDSAHPRHKDCQPWSWHDEAFSDADRAEAVKNSGDVLKQYKQRCACAPLRGC